MGWSMGTMQAATTPYTPAGTQDMAAKPGIPVIFVSSMRERRAFLCLKTYNYTSPRILLTVIILSLLAVITVSLLAAETILLTTPSHQNRGPNIITKYRRGRWYWFYYLVISDMYNVVKHRSAFLF